MITKNVSTLNIHKLTQEQYNRELLAGNIDENAIYLTTDNSQEQLDSINDTLSVIQDELNDIEGSIPTVDSALSTTSTNPVQNKAVTNWLAENVKDYAFTTDDGNVYLSDSGASLTALAPVENVGDVNQIVINGEGYSFYPAQHDHSISEVDGLQAVLDSKAASGHTHNYAGSSSAGGVANSATKLETARNIVLTGDAAGSVSFDGSGDASMTTTVSSMHGVTTAGTGAAYTATVSGITALTAGVSFIMIPHTNSTTTTPTLNVNSLGAKGIRMRGSSATGTAMTAAVTAWLASGRPVQLTYNGIYWLAEVTRPAASDLSGTVAIANGGTGATTAADAVTNLGGLSVVVSSTEPTNDNCAIWIKTS